MKAIVMHELGDARVLRLEDMPDPTAGPGEVVVAVRAAALNHRDVWIRVGQYSRIGLPCVLGSDGAGVVIEDRSGGADSLLGRDVVIDPSLNWGSDERAQGRDYRILGMPDPGTYAERIRVPAANVHPKPDHLSFEEAAAIPLAGLTAWRALMTRAQLQPGETVLVTGIGGGVATFALQIAKAAGATVYVTSGSAEKLDRARELGAAGGVNYRDADWPKQLTALMGGEGPDVIVDSAGGEGFSKLIDVVKGGGRIVNFGATTGPVPQLVLQRVFWKQVSILGTTMGSPREFAAMLAFYSKHQLRPVIDRVYPLADAAAAHQRMEEAGQFGKLVLRVD